MSHKYVYLFSEGNGNMRELLGGKGANLAEMTNLGMPVPQGFTITTEACTQYYRDDRQINSEIEAEIMQYVEKLEEMTGKKFGDLYNPLLVSVRSGARASMPGMMDTILNLGLNDEVVVAFAKKTNNPRFAYDSYRRFIQMYSDVVMEVGKKYFEQLIDEMKEARGVTLDTELTADDLKELAEKFKTEYREKLGEEFPQDPKVQLMGAIKAVFRSWDNPRAIYYRRMNDIPSDWGTAVNVQSMVFGNTGDTSGTGVAFTRNPATGEKKLFGEFLMNAQGEDVVAGVRTPQTIDQLAEVMPEAYKQFVDICAKLEYHYRDMQDMEFTIENKKLYMLQTRNGKRTAAAAMKIACDLVDEGMITEEEAVAMIDPKSLDAARRILAERKDEIAAVILEPVVQGAGGMWIYHPDYLKGLRELCDENGCLLICDEIATGFGRTGKLFACEWAGITPDIMCVGKGLTGGMMTGGAVLATARVAEGIEQAGPEEGGGVLMHGPTFMGNPLFCAVACASLDLLSVSPWKERVKAIEKELKEGLEPCRSMPGVRDVRCLGAIGVVEVEKEVDMAVLQDFFIKQGVWIRPFNHNVYLMPPYITPAEDVARLCAAIRLAVEKRLA